MKFLSCLGLCLFLLSAVTFAQPNLDSVYGIWLDEEQNDTARIKNMLRYARYGYLFSQPDSANHFAQKAADFAKEMGIKNWYSEAVKIQGISFAIRGYHKEAIEYFHEALLINEELNDSIALAGSINNIGLLHQETGDLENALEYLLRSYEMYEALDDLNGKALCSGNIGNIYDKLGDLDQALKYSELSYEFYSEMGQKKGIANGLSSLGSVTAAMADEAANSNKKEEANQLYSKALAYYESSLDLRREVNDLEGISITLNGMGRIHKNNNALQKALPLLTESLRLAKEVGSLSGIESSAIDLYDIYKEAGNYQKSLEMHELYMSSRDSVLKEENQRAVIKQEYEHEYTQRTLADSLKSAAEKKELALIHEQDLLKEKHTRNIALIVGLGILVLASGLYSRLTFVKKSRQKIQKEKDRSDELLLNILPAEVAEELKEKGTSEARNYDDATVLFTDFKSFTETAELLSAKNLVSELNACFKKFDEICQDYKIEKIKTIGDAYMAAGGLNLPKISEVKDVVLAALEMQEFMLDRSFTQKHKDLPYFEMRVGIHTGPVVAGIVGVKKFQYDIWGDTVNTASRIESNGEVGRVNISRTTYDELKDDPAFSFRSRGMIEVKGKGEIKMWFVSKTN